MLERQNPGSSSSLADQELIRAHITLQRRLQELQFQLQSAVAVKTELQHALDVCRARQNYQLDYDTSVD